VIRFLAGVIVGSLGATYIISALLPATREEREPLVGWGFSTVSDWDYDSFGRSLRQARMGEPDDTWTSGPVT
jgi:hypothetical protein